MPPNSPVSSLCVPVCHVYSVTLDHSGYPPPLSTFGAHFLLYCWTYCSDVDLCDTMASTATLMVLNQDIQNVRTFTRQFFTCEVDIQRHFRERMYRFLRSEKLLKPHDFRLLSLYASFLRAEPAAFTLELPQRTGIIPSLMIFCLRQMCFDVEGPSYALLCQSLKNMQ